VTAVAPADRPLSSAAREARFDRVDACLARTTPARPDEPARRHRACPECGTPTVLRPAPPRPGGRR